MHLQPFSLHTHITINVRHFIRKQYRHDIFENIFFLIVCSRWPWVILLVGVSAACALTVGVVFLEVTIDPVELWAAPESRSRQEKDYFDTSFTPFYRTEQVILHAEGLDGV